VTIENALQVRTENNEMTITVEDIKKYIAPKATDKELFMFIGISKSYKLNPFKREIHFVKYGDAPASIIVGYEQYLKRAERTGKLDGWKCWIEKDTIGEKACLEIKRKDQSSPIHWEVYRKEFDKQQSTWKSMPTFMLKKVAIAQGFRLAFPDELGGLPYIPEEMPVDKGGNTTSEQLPTGEVTQDAEIVEPAPSSGGAEGNIFDKPSMIDATPPTHNKQEHPKDYTKFTACEGYDRGVVVRCPSNKNKIRPKSDCNTCHESNGCPAWTQGE